MQIVAYLYSDPLLEKPPDRAIWGLEIDRVYQDIGQRHQLQQLLKESEVKPPDYLLIRHLEELGDSLAEIESAIAFLEALDIEIIATEQNYSSSQLKNTNATEFRAEFGQIIQEIQQNHQRSRLQQGHARNRLKALPPPGKACYGYRRGKDRYILDRSTAPVVKAFFDHYLLYGSLRGSVRYLEKKFGKKISVTTGQRWLANPVYRGDLGYKNGEIIPDTHTAIISREEAAQIDRLLRRNRRLPPRTASVARSLAGLVTCQKCQSAMTITRTTTKRKNQEYLYLRPISCPEKPKCKSIPYAQILEQTIERICQDLPVATAQLNSPNLGHIKEQWYAEIQQREQILTQVNTLEIEGILDSETADLRRYKVRTEIAQLRDRLAQLPPDNLQAIAKNVAIPQFWFDLSETERRFYFREFIKQIQVVRDRDSWQLVLVFIF
ncbi:MAG: recombinase family protein [Jaaginema sp. PMC 1079.18]|nr:recombinase family protein [Jaaginema sp. PMC 1080.18]MEC4850963.1 recombinase family protein [Jaaginema sp. PMC 1079.18]MEC4866236.1 recombinase family protein [Jaaginema sp. PMC 1078.18]